jgi:hypothetical protein
VTTRVKLRTEVFDLHLGFFATAARSNLEVRRQRRQAALRNAT